MTQYTATAPDGTVLTRTSKRAYTHAVLVFSHGTWGVWGFSGSFQGAWKAKAAAQRAWGSEGQAIVVDAHSSLQPETIGSDDEYCDCETKDDSRSDGLCGYCLREIPEAAECPYCAPDEKCALHQ